MVGPVSGRYLADLGADVIKVESSKRIDPVRTLGPFKDGSSGPERSVSYHNLNAGKRCITIDIRKLEGRELLLKLAKWAGRRDRKFHARRAGNELQLGYSRTEAAQPRIIMASTAMLGQTVRCEGHQRRRHDGRGDVGRDPSNRMA